MEQGLARRPIFDHTIASTGIGQHVIWETPFAFDPSPYLMSDRPHLLAVRVNNQMGWSDRDIAAPVAEAIIQRKKQSGVSHAP